MVEIDDEIALKMFQLRVAGQSERKIATIFDVTPAAVRKAVTRMCPVIDTAYRVQMHALELQRYDELYAAHYPNAKAGSEVATALCLKISDQRTSLAGSGASIKMDFQLIEATSSPALNSTQRIQQVLDDLAGMGDPKVIVDHSDDDQPR